MTDSPIIRQFTTAVIDVNDLEKEAAFWGRMIGEGPGPVKSNGGWLTVGAFPNGVQLVLQKVAEPKETKARIHIDYLVDDVDTAISEIVELGGRQISEPRPGGGVTMAYPEGNEFCIGSFTRTKDGDRLPQ